ncbi:hypothetical protein [Amycolatopsis sp. CA-230715]|uniref:hypothetical protein n=1 Tax=Amycolatopsis sp. CA-230715 TaxID=2745196 RepID=UPI001C01E64C|nr:hypothetical protein [Amycolatopsis sp. CA-230715]
MTGELQDGAAAKNAVLVHQFGTLTAQAGQVDTRSLLDLALNRRQTAEGADVGIAEQCEQFGLDTVHSGSCPAEGGSGVVPAPDEVRMKVEGHAALGIQWG